MLTPAEVDGLPDTWGGVINGIINIDIQAVHDRLELEVRASTETITGSELMRRLDRCAENCALAHKLKHKARAQYELYKEAHDEWMEPKKTASLEALEKEKKEKDLKKQITEGMIEDRVRATWSNEYRERIQRLKNFQAAVHELEDLHQTWIARGRHLESLKDLFKALR